jgi:hypothetical protein
MGRERAQHLKSPPEMRFQINGQRLGAWDSGSLFWDFYPPNISFAISITTLGVMRGFFTLLFLVLWEFN